MYHCVTSKFGLYRAAFYGVLKGDRIHFTHIDQLHVSRVPPQDTEIVCAKSHHVGKVHGIPMNAEPLNILKGAVELTYREDFEYALRPSFSQHCLLDFSPLVARKVLDLDRRFSIMLHERYNEIHEAVTQLFTFAGITSLHIGDVAIHKGNNAELSIGISGELVEAITGKFKYEGK